MGVADYAAWFAELPKPLRDNVVEHWGEPPGSVYVHDGAIRLAGLDLGSVLVMVQPPRGFGENPIALYHSPDLPPTHHYLAAYRWLERSWGADAVVHVGKHGNLEWLPGKGVGLSAACGPDATLGDLPLVYPFVVNDPGEGTQAKRRAHAVIIDHLVPPMTRAEVYDDLARLERLLDEYYQVSTLDPAKLPALRAQIWELCERSALDHDLDRTGAAPGDDDFDDFLLHLDGYLCELKDTQIRGGLHTLGRPPEGDAEIDLLAALLRLPQGPVPSLRVAVAEEWGLDLRTLLAEPGRRLDPAETGERGWVTASDAIDAIDTESKRLLRTSRDAGRPPEPAFHSSTPRNSRTPVGTGAVGRALGFAGDVLVPRLRQTTDEIANTLRALDGRYVPAGPSGAPTRGMAHVLPTGRNFYSVDPKTLPTRAAWDVGRQLADAVCQRHRAETGGWPASVGLVVWGTAAMRTHGDDIAEALALLGARPVWAEESGRVIGVEPIPLEELGRPRIDVTLRISGFFRDAFPHLVHLVDEALELVGGLDEPPELNYVRANGDDSRIFGAKPGAYGSGILALLDSKDWENDDDLATVYLAWSGYAYGRQGLRGAGPRGDAPPLLPHRRGGEEPGQPGTRHLRLRRLPPGARRDGGHRAGPAGRGGAPGLLRRFGRPRTAPGPDPGRGGPPRRAVPGAQPPLDLGHDAPRLQGSLRDGRHRRLPLRLRRHRPDRRGLDVRAGDRGLRGRPRGAEVLRRLQPLGAAGDRRTAPRSVRPGPVAGVGHQPGHAAGGTARGRGLGRGAPLPGGRGCPPPMTAPPFPLSAVVGQDDLKVALLLHAVDPKLGGVLIRGEKGSGKSTAARALATLIGTAGGASEERAPFVELPIGATEDRVVGTLDLEGALLEGRSRLRPGLLAAAHRGVLYVDEVNLLADHLVDVLIDAAAFGVNRIERDGLTAEHPCRFVLVGSMNPEEGELRPQLLDRFGLAVEVRAPRDPELRTEVVRRRLAFDADPEGFAERFAADEEALRAAIAGAVAVLGDVIVSDEVLALISRLCAELDAEGLRADLVLARGVAALAALDGRRRPPPTTSPAWRRWPWPTAAAEAPSTPPASPRKNCATPSNGRPHHPRRTLPTTPHLIGASTGPRTNSAASANPLTINRAGRPRQRTGRSLAMRRVNRREAAERVRHGRPLRRRECSWP